MKDKCYLSKENYLKSKSICDELSDGKYVKDNVSTVYNYHISEIIDNINEIHEIDESQSENNEQRIV